MRILSFIVPITYLQLPTNRAANHAASELPLPSVASGFLLARQSPSLQLVLCTRHTATHS